MPSNETGPDVKPSLVPAFLSAILPGMGDFFLPQKAKATQLRGALFLLTTVSLFASYFLGGFYQFFWAYWLFRCAFLLNLVSAALTYRSLLGRAPATQLVGLALGAIFAGWLLTGACIYLYGLRVYGVPSSAFQPTIANGEGVFCDTSARTQRNLQRGDVIIARYKGIIYVKRLVAFEGDEVVSVEGRLLVNGRPLDVPFALNGEASDQAPRNFGPTIVPHGKIFVIGDNRDFSLDSRGSQFGYPPQSCFMERFYLSSTRLTCIASVVPCVKSRCWLRSNVS